MPASEVRRRALALAIAGALVVLAVVLVLFRPAPAGSPPAAPPAAPSAAPPSAQPTQSASASVDASHGTTPPAETDTPEAGEVPVEPPVTVPSDAGPAPSDVPAEPAAPEEPPAPPPPAPFPESLRGQDLTVVPGAGRSVALTFDAGANAAGLPKILSTLAAKGIAGTFFLTGNWAANNPQGVAQIAAAGHRVTFAGPPDSRALVEHHGLDFLPLEPSRYDRFLQDDASVPAVRRVLTLSKRRQQAVAAVRVDSFTA